MYAVCNKKAIGSAYKNWIMNLILKISLVDSQDKLESHHHGYCVEVAMDKINWKHTTVSIILLFENTVFCLQYLWQTNSERRIVWNDPQWNQMKFIQ